MGLFAVTVSASEYHIANEKWPAPDRQAEVVIP
jgi:hypothetical protein